MFKNKIEKYKLESRVLSYIDESGFASDMPRRYGYSKVGNRCYGTYNWNAKGRENVIGALDGGLMALIAGIVVVSISFLFVPLISNFKNNK